MSNTVVITDEDGTTHEFKSDLGAFVHCNEWIAENKSKEENAIWDEFQKTGIKTDASVEIYNSWITSQQICHTRTTPTGEKTVVNHIDL